MAEKVTEETGTTDKKGNSGAAFDAVVIKKYANRRLYNTASSSYVTLETLAEMVRQDVDFVVVDAKTGADITRSVLTQIIVEQEGKGQNLLPVSVLRQLISMYDNNMRWLLPGYLEMAMDTFQKNQEQMRGYMKNAFGGIFPVNQFEQVGQQNMAVFEQMMKMFMPGSGEAEKKTPPPEGPATTGAGGQDGPSVEERLAELQREIETLSKQKRD